MTLKTLAVAAALALAAVTAAPASAAPKLDCHAHLDTIIGGICIPGP